MGSFDITDISILQEKHCIAIAANLIPWHAASSTWKLKNMENLLLLPFLEPGFFTSQKTRGSENYLIIINTSRISIQIVRDKNLSFPDVHTIGLKITPQNTPTCTNFEPAHYARSLIVAIRHSLLIFLLPSQAISHLDSPESGTTFDRLITASIKS